MKENTRVFAYAAAVIILFAVAALTVPDLWALGLAAWTRIGFITGVVLVIQLFPVVLPQELKLSRGPYGNLQLFLPFAVYIATAHTVGLPAALCVIWLTRLFACLHKKTAGWDALVRSAGLWLAVWAGFQLVRLMGLDPLVPMTWKSAVAGAGGGAGLLGFLVFFIVYGLIHTTVLAGWNAGKVPGNFFQELWKLTGISAGNWLMVLLASWMLGVLMKADFMFGSLAFLGLECMTAVYSNRFLRQLQYTRQKAEIDELTGVYNHRYFQQALEEKIGEASDSAPLSLLFLDIDHFKEINDRYGHQAGDRVLKGVADCVQSMVSREMVFARYGGEEFIVLAPGYTSAEALGLADQLRKQISLQSYRASEGGKYCSVTVSIGISTYPEISGDKQTLIAHADKALYTVKKQGRNQSRVYRLFEVEVNPAAQGLLGEEVAALIADLNAVVRAKDMHTFGHQARVKHYAMVFADWLGLDEKNRRILEAGALLHDIGKLEIPREILGKRGQLSDQEWQWIRNHAENGASLLSGIPQLKIILPLVRHHHERYDGKGYPDRLAGDEIPYLARMLSIVDSFDAMTTDRIYQQSKTYTEAVREMRRCSGTQFDPLLLEAFIEMLESTRRQGDPVFKYVEGL